MLFNGVNKLIYEAYASDQKRLAKLRNWANELSPCGYIFFTNIDLYRGTEIYDFYNIDGFLDHINYPDMTVEEIFDLYGEPMRFKDGINMVAVDENVWTGFNTKEVMSEYFINIFNTGEREDKFGLGNEEMNLTELCKIIPPHIYLNKQEYNISDEEIDELFS